ncbi:MAG: hypothetical protein HRT71_03955 [Flavobacteriales bacterium]|nr:hypothetical protein [Flavobacteriales bacterium]
MKTDKTKVFTMRMDEDTKRKLESLASCKEFRYNNSAVIRTLIQAEHFKNQLNDEV